MVCKTVIQRFPALYVCTRMYRDRAIPRLPFLRLLIRARNLQIPKAANEFHAHI